MILLDSCQGIDQQMTARTAAPETRKKRSARMDDASASDVFAELP
jgi:hypothetical protein